MSAPNGSGPAPPAFTEHPLQVAQLLATLVGAAPVAVAALDREGRVRLWNPSAEHMLGWSRDEVLGEACPMRGAGPGSDRAPATQRALRGETIAGEESVLLRKDGRPVDVEIWGAPLLDERGGIAGAITLLADIGERKRAEDDLQRSIEELRRVDTHRRTLLGRLLRAQEEERKRIAGDLHDDSIQAMSAAALRVSALRTKVADPEHLAALEKVERDIHTSIERLRHLMVELRPPALEREGLVGALRLLLLEAEDRTNLAWRMDCDLPEEPPAETGAVLYRVAREALSNVEKHAGASTVRVVIRGGGDAYRLEVRDDGKGFAPGEQAYRAGHLGLIDMRERIEMAGGRLRLATRPGAGTSVACWLPSLGDGEAA